MGLYFFVNLLPGIISFFRILSQNRLERERERNGVSYETHKILRVTNLDLRRGAEGRKATPATVTHKKLLRIQRQKVDEWVPGGGC